MKKKNQKLKSYLPGIIKGGLTVLISVLIIFTVAQAVPPQSPYLPGETLAPSCSPGGTNCKVALTSGSVLFSDGTNLITQDNSNFYWDDTNNRLGIGTTTPGALLDVQGAATFTTGTFTGNLTTTGNLIFDLANDVTIQATAPAAARIYTIPDFGSDDTFVGLAASQTLTNKTLTTPIIASLYQDVGKTKLLTMPAATDTLVGKATTDALTNKTYEGLTITSSTGALTIAAAKVFSVNNTLTLTATDGSTLAIGAGGTLGTAAYTASTAYEASGAVTTHAALLTGVHGLAITAGKTLTVQDNVTITGALGTGAYATIANYAPLASPVFTTQITTPLIYGSSADAGTLTLEGSSFDDGADTYIILNPNGGNVGIGTTGPDRKLDVLDASAAQLRLTYSDNSVYTDFTLDTNGNLTINPAKNVYLKHSATTGSNLWVCEGTACQGADTSMGSTGGNLVVEGGIYGGTRCPSDMVYVPGDRPFCIDKFEAYTVSGTVVNDTCTNGSQAEVDANTTTAIAGSDTGKTPLVSINWCVAKKACQNAGKHLCTNPEWFQACNYKGSQWSITAEQQTEAMACNTEVSAPDPHLTGAAATCVTQEGALDMIGNVWEWVDKVVTADPTNGLTTSNYVTGYDFATGLPTSVGVTTAAYGNDYFWAYNGAGAARAALRGGDWSNGALDGCFTLDLSYAPSTVNTSLGFRCCQ